MVFKYCNNIGICTLREYSGYHSETIVFTWCNCAPYAACPIIVTVRIVKKQYSKLKSPQWNKKTVFFLHALGLFSHTSTVVHLLCDYLCDQIYINSASQTYSQTVIIIGPHCSAYTLTNPKVKCVMGAAIVFVKNSSQKLVRLCGNSTLLVMPPTNDCRCGTGG